MSSAPAIPDRTKDELLAKGRSFKVIKITIAFLLVLLLTYIGHRGRQHVRLQMRLNGVTVLRDQLQQKLDDVQSSNAEFLRLAGGSTISPSRPASSDREIKDLANTLKIQLMQFDSDYRSGELPEVENLEVRLSNATLANAEQRFSDALTTVTDKDEKREASSPQVQNAPLVRVLQIRGDSFYGLHQWQEALDRYQHMLFLQPNRIVTMARIADCQYALGKLDEAVTTCDGLARIHNYRANAFLVQSKPDIAIRHYEKAIEIQTWLSEQRGRSEVAADLAMSHYNLGGAFLLQERPDLAVGHYEKAIQLQTLLGERQGRNELASDLAMSHHNLGNALLSQQKFEVAAGHYEKAIEIQTRLIEVGRSKLADDLARSYNNRGVVLRALGKLDAAVADFQNAISMLTPLLEQEEHNELGNGLAISRTNPVAFPSGVKLEVAIEFAERRLEVSTQARFIAQGRRRALAVALAISLKNLGYAHLLQGKLDAAFVDFKRAMEIYARLVEQEGQKDLALEFAMSLSPVAWIYATNPDRSSRDGGKAKEFALKACELSQWNAFFPLETLAAACAEIGNLAEAVKWQQKALELAPDEDKPQLLSKLQLYKSGNPYRAPLNR